MSASGGFLLLTLTAYAFVGVIINFEIVFRTSKSKLVGVHDVSRSSSTAPARSCDSVLFYKSFELRDFLFPQLAIGRVCVKAHIHTRQFPVVHYTALAFRSFNAWSRRTGASMVYMNIFS